MSNERPKQQVQSKSNMADVCPKWSHLRRERRSLPLPWGPTREAPSAGDKFQQSLCLPRSNPQTRKLQIIGCMFQFIDDHQHNNFKNKIVLLAIFTFLRFTFGGFQQSNLLELGSSLLQNEKYQILT